MNGCNGTTKNDGPGIALDEGDVGAFTKEYAAEALKEGWANLVAAATWNDFAEDDCEFQGITVSNDWDLDDDRDQSHSWWAACPYPCRVKGGIDVAGGSLVGTFECEGQPKVVGYLTSGYVWSPPAGMDTSDWLDDMESIADVGGAGPGDCQAASSYEYNRTTVFDVTRFYWDLLTDVDLTREELSDLHVGTCFDDWASGDGVVGPTDPRLPFNRIRLSADRVMSETLETEVIDELEDQLEH